MGQRSLQESIVTQSVPPSFEEAWNRTSQESIDVVRLRGDTNTQFAELRVRRRLPLPQVCLGREPQGGTKGRLSREPTTQRRRFVVRLAPTLPRVLRGTEGEP